NFEISPDGRLIVLCGRFGNIHLLTANSLEGVGLLKMNNEVSAITFSNDGSRLFSHGEGGEVYVWDIGSRRCLGRFIDDGCIWGKSLAVAPGGRFLACGARSGVVNLYETESLTSSGSNAPTPTKILLNLTTAATSVKFNSSTEILAMASDEKDNAMKLVHFPSMTVFSNFPGSSNTYLSRPQCLDFSPGSGFLAIGNNKNTALLYRQMLMTEDIKAKHFLLCNCPCQRRMVICSVLAFFSLFSKAMAANRERTFLMVKPDGVQRGLVGKIIKRLESKGFKLVAMKFMWVKDLLKKHYADLSARPFFPGLVKYMSSGPVVPMVWEGLNVVKTGRVMLGATDPKDSNPGTIRGDLCIQVGRNIIHGSDSVESANKEIDLWFDSKEVVQWQPATQIPSYTLQLPSVTCKSNSKMTERTLIMITPDGIQRGYIGEVIQRLEDRGFRLIAVKFVWPPEELWKEHYEEHKEKDIFPALIKSMLSGPVLPMVWEGEDAIKMGRAMLGATDPTYSHPGTVRGDYSIQVSCRNIIHGSDSTEAARREINLWFQPHELV
ncbi:hypothetical protein L9F63_003264, partial [Diploptera punctata]